MIDKIAFFLSTRKQFLPESICNKKADQAIGFFVARV
jgi:hypothetical protein